MEVEQDFEDYLKEFIGIEDFELFLDNCLIGVTVSEVIEVLLATVVQNKS